MLINAWSGSGGDAFPYYFRAAGLGPLIGTRTWGGLIGYSGFPGLIDGGVVTVPTFSFYNPNGEWEVEGYGVAPDIEVVEDPSLMMDGGDPQLDRAIAEVLGALEENPPLRPERPEYPVR
jgi:tricorn protease